MPTTGVGAFWERNPRAWAACRREAAAQMMAEGWPPKARKFDEVMMRRARRLFAQVG